MDRKALRDLLHIRWEQGDKAAAAARSINEMVGQDVLSNRVAQYWFKLFREGRQATTHKRGAGRRPTVNKRVLAQRLQRKKDISTRELASGVCSQNTAWQWLRKNGYRSRAGRFVPHDLTPAQKENRVTACLQLLRRHRQGRFLRRIVTTDECWVCYDGRVRKPQWLKPNEVLNRPQNQTPMEKSVCFLSFGLSLDPFIGNSSHATQLLTVIYTVIYLIL